MAKSLLRRITPQDLQTIRDSVAYDPTAPNGLRWLVKCKGRRPTGIGRTFWIGQFSYQASQIVMILNGKFPADGDSVVTRIDKDGSWGDVDNLMWAPRGSQVAGGRDRNRRKLLQAVFGDAVPDLSEGLRLAILCKRRHQWNGYPVTLQSRQGSEWKCLDCQRENRISPAAVATRQAWYQENIEQIRQKSRERWQLEYQTNPDRRLYHREKSRRRKAQNRGQTPVQISVSAIRLRFNSFGNCCAYCGTAGEMELEHVVAISQGGAHDISNIVPACNRCNSSKRTQPMEQWYRAQPFFSDLRLRRILRVTGNPSGQQLLLSLA